MIVEIRWDRPDGAAVVAIGGTLGPAALAGSRDIEGRGVEGEIPMKTFVERTQIESRIVRAALLLLAEGIETEDKDRWL